MLSTHITKNLLTGCLTEKKEQIALEELLVGWVCANLRVVKIPELVYE